MNNQEIELLQHNNQESVLLQHNNQEFELLQHNNQEIDLLQHNNQEIDLLQHNNQEFELLQHNNQEFELLQHNNQEFVLLQQNNINQYVLLQHNIVDSNQIYGQCIMCNILIPLTNNSVIYSELCCNKCSILMNNINLWQSCTEKISYIKKNRIHYVYKHKLKDYYIICESVFNKKNKLIAFHYAKKMKTVYCRNCFKDSISFHDILDNYCPQCNNYDTISYIYYRWVVVADKYNTLNIIPKIKFIEKNHLSQYFIGPIEIYNHNLFNYEKIFLIKKIYLNQNPFVLIQVDN